MWEHIGYAIVPAMFLAAAAYFFTTHSDIAGGVCILVAFLVARN